MDFEHVLPIFRSNLASWAWLVPARSAVTRPKWQPVPMIPTRIRWTPKKIREVSRCLVSNPYVICTWFSRSWQNLWNGCSWNAGWCRRPQTSPFESGRLYMCQAAQANKFGVFPWKKCQKQAQNRAFGNRFAVLDTYTCRPFGQAMNKPFLFSSSLFQRQVARLIWWSDCAIPSILTATVKPQCLPEPFHLHTSMLLCEHLGWI